MARMSSTKHLLPTRLTRTQIVSLQSLCKRYSTCEGQVAKELPYRPDLTVRAEPGLSLVSWAMRTTARC